MSQSQPHSCGWCSPTLRNKRLIHISHRRLSPEQSAQSRLAEIIITAPQVPADEDLAVKVSECAAIKLTAREISQQQAGKRDVVRRDIAVSPWQPASGTPDSVAHPGGPFSSLWEEPVVGSCWSEWRLLLAQTHAQSPQKTTIMELLFTPSPRKRGQQSKCISVGFCWI